MARFEKLQTSNELLNRIQVRIEQAFRDLDQEMSGDSTEEETTTTSETPVINQTIVQEIDISQFAPIDHTHDFNEVPGGGTINQVLTKDSIKDYDVSWKDVPLFELGAYRIPSEDFSVNIIITERGIPTDQAEDNSIRFIIDSSNNNKVYAFNRNNRSYNQERTFNLDSSNTTPYGIEIFVDNIYVTNESDTTIKIYNKLNGSLNSDKNINLFTSLNINSIDISSDNEFIYMLNSRNIDSIPIVFKERKVNINLHEENTNPTGLHVKDGVCYVVDGTLMKVFAYNRVSGDRILNLEFDLDTRNQNPRRLSINDLNRFYILDNNSYFVYENNRGTRMYPLDSLNSNPTGIYATNRIIYISDSADEIAYSYREVTGERTAGNDLSIGTSDSIAGFSNTLFKINNNNNIINGFSISDNVSLPKLTIDFRKSNSKPRGLYRRGRVLFCVDEDNHVFSYNILTGLYLPLMGIDLSDIDSSEPYDLKTLGISGINDYIFVSGETEQDGVITNRVFCYNTLTGDRDRSKDYFSESPNGIFIRDKITWFCSNTGSFPAYITPIFGSFQITDNFIKNIVKNDNQLNFIRQDDAVINVDLVDGFIDAIISGGNLILNKTSLNGVSRETKLNIGGISLTHTHDSSRNLLHIPFDLPSPNKKEDLSLFVKENGSIGGVSSVTYEGDVSLTTVKGDKLVIDLVQTQSFSNGGRTGTYEISQESFTQSLVSRATSSYFNGKTNVFEGFDESVNLDLMSITGYSNELNNSVTSLGVSNIAISQTGNNLVGLRVIDQFEDRQNGALALRDVVARRTLNLILAQNLQGARNGNALVYELNSVNIIFSTSVENKLTSSVLFGSSDSRNGTYEFNITNGNLGNKLNNNVLPLDVAQHPDSNIYYSILNTHISSDNYVFNLYTYNPGNQLRTLVGQIQGISSRLSTSHYKLIFIGSILYLVWFDRDSDTTIVNSIDITNLTSTQIVSFHRRDEAPDISTATSDGSNIYIAGDQSFRSGDGSSTFGIWTLNLSNPSLSNIRFGPRVSGIVNRRVPRDDGVFHSVSGMIFSNNNLYAFMIDRRSERNIFSTIPRTGNLNLSNINVLSNPNILLSGLRDISVLTVPSGNNVVNSITPVYNNLSNSQNIGYVGLIESYTEQTLGSSGGSATLSGNFNLVSYNYDADSETLKIVLTGIVAANSFAVLRIQQSGSDVISLNSSDATFSNNSFTWSSITTDPIASNGDYRFIFQTTGTGIASFEYRKINNENFEIDSYNNKNYLRILAGSNINNGDSILVSNKT